MGTNSQAGGAGPVLTGAEFDICAPGILPVDQIGFVESVQRQFLQTLAVRLSDCLQTPVTTDLTGIEQMQFPEFLNSCSGDACLIPLKSEPGGGRGILELSAGFVHRVLSILIGAPASASGSNRVVTGIERHILRECFADIILNLEEAWAGYGVHFTAEEMVQVDAQSPLLINGTGVVANLSLNLSGGQESMRLALPALLVRLAAKQPDSHVVPSRPDSRPHLLDALRDATVEVEAVLGGASLRMRDLLTLEPGQLLLLGPPTNCNVECVINGVSKFRGELVSNGRNQAFQIGLPIETRPGARG